jgi:hypothetical protein
MEFPMSIYNQSALTVVLLSLLSASAARAQTAIYAATEIYPMCIRPAGDTIGEVGVEGEFPGDCSIGAALWSSVRNGLRSDIWLRNHVTGTPDKALTYLAPGDSVGLRPYSGTDPSQLWTPIFARRFDGIDWFVLYNRAADLCLKAPSSPPYSHTALVMNLQPCPEPASAAANNDLFSSSIFPPPYPPALDSGRVTVRPSTGSGFGPAIDWTEIAYYGTRGTFFADVTGDGYADAIVVNDDTVTVRRSTGSAFTSNEDWTRGPFYGSRGSFFADVTGDGRADAIVVNDDTVTVRPSTGSAFKPNEDWTKGSFHGTYGTFFADANGDGRADAIRVDDGGVTVRLSTGSAFGSPTSWIAIKYVGTRDTLFADVTGDRWADAVVVNNDTVTVRRAAADCGVFNCWNFRFNPNEDWTRGPYFGGRKTILADVTGDGRADAIVVNDGTVTVRRAVADCNPFSCWNFRFGPNEDWTGGSYFGNRGTFFADVTGDGRADAIKVSR